MNSICFDTETTGLHPNGSDPDEILTISIIGRDGSVLLDERFRPTVKTEWPHASAVNGIYPEDVADLPTIETAIPRLREIFAGADEIIGYNVGFDLGFLSAVGVRPREDARITDTMNEFTWFMGRRYKLVDAADHIGYEWTGRAHGSLADALATLSRLLKKEYPEIREKLWKEAFWSQSFCLLTAGGASVEVIRQYIESQGEKKY